MSGELRPPEDDICRCHDHDCPQRKICTRFVYRDLGGPQTPHVESMRFLPGCEQYDYSGKPHEKDGIA